MVIDTPIRRTYRRSKAEQTALEQQVVKVCLQLFAQGGYEAVSMRKLASEVGMAPMSLYRYFPTKAHLMRHLWDDIVHRACQQALDQAASATSPTEQLRAFLGGFVDYWLDHRSHYWVVFALRDDLSELNAAPGADVMRPNLSEVREAIDRWVCASAAPLILTPRERHELSELCFQRQLGFLLGVIGLASVPRQDVLDLKDQMLDSCEQHIRNRVSTLTAQQHHGSSTVALTN